jgi:hypothetical protein
MLARIFKYSDLSWSALTQIKRWFNRSAAREGFTLDSFNNNPSLRVAQAVNSVGQTVCLTPIESCYLVGAYIFNPDATSVEIPLAGDAIDRELACLAQREGVSKFLIALPNSHPSESGEKWIRVVQREVKQPVVMGGVSRAQATAAQFN